MLLSHRGQTSIYRPLLKDQSKKVRNVIIFQMESYIRGSMILQELSHKIIFKYRSILTTSYCRSMILQQATFTGSFTEETLQPLFWSSRMNSINARYEILFTSCNHACNGIIFGAYTILYQPHVEFVPGLNPIF